MDNNAQQRYGTFRTRWYVLVIYSSLGMACNLVSTTISPIGPIAQSALHLTQTDVALMPNWFNVMFLISVMPYMYLLQKTGLRLPIVTGAVFVAFGACVRCFSSGGDDETFDRLIIHAGQIVNGCGSSILWFGCTKLSVTWFPPAERTLSTTIALLSGPLGVALSFVVGPYTVNGLAASWADQFKMPVETYYAQAIHYLFYGEAIACFCLCASVLVYFPAQPPTPPCRSATTERFNFKDGIVNFLTNRDAWVILILSSVSTAVIGGWSLFLPTNVGSVMDNIESGWLGFGMTVGSIVSGPITTLTSKLWLARWPRLVCASIMGAGAFCSVLFWFAAELVPTLFTKAWCWVTLLGASFFISGCPPLWWELACEAVYPVPEQIVAGFFALGSTLVSITFLVLNAFPALGSHWSNWCLAISETLCIGLVFFYSGARRRQAEDERTMLLASNSVESSNRTTYT